ncbi:cutinase family protein [Nocardia sp. NBC_00508]|uniref:cutinase family protein n=1 Tax=Nocardia sp. NBC_00508 TaxID=2975992 RepID=UPI002E819BAD|nr:cutinase family protein [Nocardia sp. NBC_00508]WUD66984.1 cutinase family protein [Nocardia sp. NBC_00508]
MANRKVIHFEKWLVARAFAVLLLVAGFAAATGLHAWAMSCAAVDVVVARGTHEPGYLGSVVGDPLYDTLRQELLVSSQSYRVNYPADLLDPASISRGTQDMTAHVLWQAEMCPDQRFVLVGFSQGAVVTHGVLGTGIATALGGIHSLPVEVESRVAAVLLFGDPIHLLGWNVPPHYADRTGNYCTSGDPICGGGIHPVSHTDYEWAIWPAAQFAACRV